MFVDPEGNPQECGGAFPTPMMAIWDWCGLRKIIPRRNWSTTLKYKFSSEAIPQKMDYPTGAFWLFRREVYQRVGKFDERFFLYFEETDFAKRALKQGWPAYVHPRIIIEHIKGASFQATQSSAVGDPLAIYFESLFKYLFKHFNKPCVIFTAAAIRNFLNLRKFIYKNEKSAKVLDAFTEGSSRALGYEELNHRQEK
jgi:GT2 family glycosyltransferase